MNMKLKIAVAAGFASLLGMSSQADATDVRLVNLSNVSVHPWVKSNCFATIPRNQWVNFGNVNAYGQFTWPEFELLLDPTCKRPVLEMTYNVGTMAPPLDNLPSQLVSRIRIVAGDTTIVGVYVAQAAVFGSAKKEDSDD